jgi:hypothetical protein
VPLYAEELAGIAARFKIPGILEILAAIEKIRHLVFPWCHRGNTRHVTDLPCGVLGGPAATAGGFIDVSSRGERRRSENVMRRNGTNNHVARLAI